MTFYGLRTLCAAGAFGLLNVGAAAPAAAQDASTAIEMISNCRVALRLSQEPASVSDAELPAATFCMGWAQGMLDGITAANDDLANAAGVGNLTSPNCIKDGEAAIGQAVMAFLNYAETQPDSLLLGEGQMMFEALAKTYPCNRN